MGILEKGAWLLSLIFFALKVAGVSDMSWLTVILPVLINYTIFVAALGLVWIGQWRMARKNRSWIDRL